jgi:hypothetical protein
MCRIPTCTFIGGFLCKARQAFLLVRLFVQSADFLCRRDYLCKARCERKIPPAQKFLSCSQRSLLCSERHSAERGPPLYSLAPLFTGRGYRPSLSLTLRLASTAAASTAECAISSLSLSVL